MKVKNDYRSKFFNLSNWKEEVGRASHRYRGGHGFESRWSPDFFQASSFQLLKLENLLRWSFFTFIFILCSEMICFLFNGERQWKKWSTKRKQAVRDHLRGYTAGDVNTSGTNSFTCLHFFFSAHSMHDVAWHCKLRELCGQQRYTRKQWARTTLKKSFWLWEQRKSHRSWECWPPKHSLCKNTVKRRTIMWLALLVEIHLN